MRVGDIMSHIGTDFQYAVFIFFYKRFGELALHILEMVGENAVSKKFIAHETLSNVLQNQSFFFK